MPGMRTLLAVTDGIDFNFSTHEVFIDKDRMILGDLGRVAYIAPELLLAIDDFHRSTAQHIRGADEHRIADPARHGARVVKRRDRGARWLRDRESAQKAFETMPVLGKVY